ncbi:MAG: hypothetical protein ACK4ZC_05790, partial [Bacteroidota bacterium]
MCRRAIEIQCAIASTSKCIDTAIVNQVTANAQCLGACSRKYIHQAAGLNGQVLGLQLRRGRSKSQSTGNGNTLRSLTNGINGYRMA